MAAFLTIELCGNSDLKKPVFRINKQLDKSLHSKDRFYITITFYHLNVFDN